MLNILLITSWVCRNGDKGKKLPCKMFLFKGLKLIYGDELKEKETDMYTIYGHPLHPRPMVLLFMAVIFVYCCTVIGFWSEFLVLETNQCDTTMDCFVQNKSQNGIVVGDPLPVMETCSDYENDNFYVSCFKFVFDYAGAIGDAGGVLVLGSVIMNMQAGLWFGALALINPTGRILSLSALSMLYILVCIIFTCLIYIVQSYKLFKDSLLSTNHDMLKFYIYMFTFYIAFSFSGPLFSMIDLYNFFRSRPEDVESNNGQENVELKKPDNKNYESIN